MRAKKQFIKFLLVGGLNTLFGYGVYFALLKLGLSFPLAALLSTILGILFNFKTTGFLVFQSKENRLLIRFFIVYGFLYLFNTTGIFIMTNLSVSPQVGGALMLMPVAILGFFLNKYYVFKH